MANEAVVGKDIAEAVGDMDDLPVAFATNVPVSVPGVDAVPLIDANTAGFLAAVKKVKVQQRSSAVEPILEEEQNVYYIFDIFDASTGKLIFVAVGSSDCCERFCCAPYHSVALEFKAATGRKKKEMTRDNLDDLPTVMWAGRQGRGSCNKFCIGCCICCPCCANEMFVHAGEGPPAVGGQSWEDDQLIGHIAQPVPFGGGFTPTLNIMERASPVDSGRRSPSHCQAGRPVRLQRLLKVLLDRPMVHLVDAAGPVQEEDQDGRRGDSSEAATPFHRGHVGGSQPPRRFCRGVSRRQPHRAAAEGSHHIVPAAGRVHAPRSEQR